MLLFNLSLLRIYRTNLSSNHLQWQSMYNAIYCQKIYFNEFHLLAYNTLYFVESQPTFLPASL
jgi:undecaprenyl pyrophosphate synthase